MSRPARRDRRGEPRHPRRPGRAGARARRRAARDGYPVTFVPINPRFPAALRWVRRVPYLRTLLNQALYLPSLVALARADVVHVFSASYWSFLLAPVPAMRRGARARQARGAALPQRRSRRSLADWGLLVHPWLRLADVIVVPSEYLRRGLRPPRLPARVIPNVVDLSRFATASGGRCGRGCCRRATSSRTTAWT